MKFTAALLFGTLSSFWSTAAMASADADGDEVVLLRRDEDAFAAARELQDNNNYYYNGNANGANGGYNNGYQNNQNFEEYMRMQMMYRTFSFTGCSQVKSSSNGNANYNNGNNGNYNNMPGLTYVTYRLCDKCSSRSHTGCGNTDGDYVVTMQQFAEAYGEYIKDSTGSDISPLECVKAEELIQNYYQYQYQNYNGAYQNQNGQQQNGQYNGQYNGNYNNYNNGNNGNNANGNYQNQNAELFIGPSCSGNGASISLAVFYDDACMYPADNMSVKQVLGFNPETRNLQPNQCTGCAMTQYGYYGQQQNGEVNPLCDRLLEESGRCDRTADTTTTFDSFWQQIVDYVNGGQQQGYANGNNANGNNGNNANGNYNGQYQNQGYNNANGYMMNYYQFQNENTCSFIDSLPHASGSWGSLKSTTSNRSGMGVGGILGLLVAIGLLGVGAWIGVKQFLARRNNNKKENLSSADYQEMGKSEMTPPTIA